MKFHQIIKNSGFSMLELVIALAIGLIVLGALTTTFVMQRTRYDAQEQVTDMTQNGRAAMDMIVNEAIMAGYNPTGDLQTDDPTTTLTFVGIDPVSATNFIIYADLNGDGETDGTDTGDDGGEVIEYEFDGANMVLKRGLDGGATIDFAENIQAFNVNYLGPGSVAVTDSDQIRKLEISITARTGEPDGNFPANGGYRTIVLTSDVRVRNMGLQKASSGGSGTTTTTVPGSTTTTTIVSTTTTVPVTTTTATVPVTTTTSTTSPTSSTTTSITATTTTGLPSTTTTTIPECLAVQVSACKPTGNAKIYAEIRVLVNGSSASEGDNVTVTWRTTVATNPDVTIDGPWTTSLIGPGYFGDDTDMSLCGSYFYFAVTPNNAKYQNSQLPIGVWVDVTKEGCQPVGTHVIITSSS
jgi:prepilin-type N-terminal cleavage/methylation domain-containing protein